MHRLLDGMKDRMIDSTNLDITKVVALNADPSKPHFGLDQGIFAQLQTEVTLIVHAAWPVNFNISLESFEPHLEGLRNLLQFSLANGARCFFCSSVSVAHNLHAGKTSVESTGRVAEAPITDLRHAGYTGYAQSKLVGEHMVLAAARAGAKSHVLRIGQLVGDTQNGVWNEKEFIPSMVRSAMHIGALPDLKEVQSHQNHEIPAYPWNLSDACTDMTCLLGLLLVTGGRVSDRNHGNHAGYGGALQV